MARLNYRHLQYFHTVVQEGGVRAAAQRLHLTPQTISGQLRLLEEQLGAPLLERAGRGVEPTEAGRVALDYARDIFALGDELAEVLRTGVQDRPVEFRVGVLDSVPKSIAHWLLEPALALEQPLRIVCRQQGFAGLLAELAVHRLDLVIADSPHPPGLNVSCYNHPLGASHLACFGTPGLARAHPGPFPARLDGAPLLLPREGTAWRGAMLRWLERNGVQPWIRGEFDDTGLMKAFGHAGAGFLFAPEVMADEICAQYALERIGSTKEVRQEVFAITVERRISHPAVRAITEHARGGLGPRARETRTRR